MKHLNSIVILAVAICCFNFSFAQTKNTATKGFSYQAVARTANGEIMSTTPLNIRISLIEDNENGRVVYQEEHSAATNQFGLFTLKIGQGKVVSGAMDIVRWGQFDYFIKIEADAKGGNDYSELGTSQILAAPYAIRALESESVIDGSSGSRAGDDWLKLGNSGTTPGTNFLGNTDSVALVVKTNNTERMRVQGDGDVEIGGKVIAVSNEAKLMIDAGSKTYMFNMKSTSLTPRIYFQAANASASNIVFGSLSSGGFSMSSFKFFNFNMGANTCDFAINTRTAGDFLTVKDAGKLGVGTTNPQSKMDVEGSVTIGATYSGTNAAPTNGLLVEGNVGIGTTSPSYKLHVSGTLKSNGITESSDLRLKKNISPLKNSLNAILALRGVNYEWRIDEFKNKNLDKGVQIGLIAQEVEKILPEAVDTDNEGYKSVRYSHLIAVLIEAIKEQQTIIANQKNQLEANNTKLEELKNSYNSLILALENAGIPVDKKLAAEIK